MKLISAILGGFAFGLVAAIAAIAAGYGVLAAIGGYIVFGMIGTVLAAVVTGPKLRPFFRSREQRKRDSALTVPETAVGNHRF